MNKKTIIVVLLMVSLCVLLNAQTDSKGSRNSRNNFYVSNNSPNTRSNNVPNLIPFQGRLTDDSGNSVNETVNITFSLYDVETGGSALWNETQSVSVTEGLFKVTLGNITPLDEDNFSSANRWIGISVGTDSEMSPRTRISAVPYALQSGTSTPDNDWTIDGDDVYHETGNVGIGTTTATTALEVNGTVTATSFTGDGSALTGIAGDDLGNHAAMQNINLNGNRLSGDGDDEGVFVEDNGNVGIGTTYVEDNKLKVYRTSSDHGPDKSSIFGFRTGTSGEVNGGTGWNESGIDAAIKGYSYFGNNYTAGIAGYSYLDYANSAAIIGARFNGDPRAFLAYKDVNSVNWAGYFVGKTYISDKLGIGVENPTEKLEVDGTVKATSFTGDGSVLLSGDGDDEGVFVNNDGKVGIGTTIPEKKLSVIGTIRASNDIDETEYVEIVHGGANGVLNWNGDGDLDFRYNTGTLATLQQNGTLEVSNNVNVSGDIDVIGKISSSQSSFYWFSGQALVMNGTYVDEAKIYFSIAHVSRIFRNNNSGNTTVYLPLNGLPKHVYGQQTKIASVRIFYKVSSGSMINTTTVYHGYQDVANNSSPQMSTTEDYYDVTFSTPLDISNSLSIAFDSFHAGSGTANDINITKVKVELQY